jgi:DNA polymerase III epsilon subunit-like protein
MKTDKSAKADSGEFFISVDVETSGPNPTQYSLLSIGACTLDEPPATFYVELKPVNMRSTRQAMEVSHLSLEELAEDGLPPAEAMGRFDSWLATHVPPGVQPVFVGFNAPFDWSFVNDYFHRFLGRNPFGHAALDIKSFYMGLAGVQWSETSLRQVSQRYLENRPLTHHALRDALDQATIFRKMLLDAQKTNQETDDD